MNFRFKFSFVAASLFLIFLFSGSILHVHNSLISHSDCAVCQFVGVVVHGVVPTSGFLLVVLSLVLGRVTYFVLVLQSIPLLALGARDPPFSPFSL
ncbi:MAG: hypothetical protein EXS67_02755 [Candidatus Margulisbacteria bacterium]|nr:hypothetical protein [Candidatus Margulisiibacteriota bacterium]